MILGFHLTWTTYGHWFPNDPRGSWSDEVWKPQLARIRPLDDGRKVTRPRPVPRRYLQRFLHEAQGQLKWRPVVLSPSEIAVVGKSFSESAMAMELNILACAILANHVHLVTERHAKPYERIINRLKGQSAQRIRAARNLPVAAHRRDRVAVWTQGYWVRYINDTAHMERTLAYVRNNPVRSGLGVQEWSFVSKNESPGRTRQG